MTAFEKSYSIVCSLVETFRKNAGFYSSPTYNEANVRTDFINKFFIALGWDVTHEHQINPYEREVIVEKGQRIENSIAQKRADYAFYISPNFKDVQFFVEAKKPSLGLYNPTYYFQTARYGWNAGTPVSVLTDFEEFHIVDCRFKPEIINILEGANKQYKYDDYESQEKFAEIYYLFSREAILNNSLKKYEESLPKPNKKGIVTFRKELQSIDDSFLNYIDKIRERLAQCFVRANSNLSSEAITEIVQRTIDRLVFVRFLEDKIIETEDYINKWRRWQDFIKDSEKLNAKYNGVVFKSHLLDTLSLAGLEEKEFLEISNDIGSQNNPYDFNYIPIHILGSIYERFLSKQVSIKETGVLIEDKPAVKKAGGVYYTPKHIVDYIVENTVGKYIQGKTPAEISKMRFADISCGSGSFLIGVYDYLLEYHRNYYRIKYENRKKNIDARNEDFNFVEYKDNAWIITLNLKQRILLNNIYGVDVDHQAVEVTQLSLFLKMLEDENVGTTQIKQGSLFSKVLPDLSNNIVSGNSLIETSINELGLFSFETEKILNPFDFTSRFENIMQNGFDVIVGNPPYVKLQALREGHSFATNYFNDKYKSAAYGNYDLYVLFVERAMELLRDKGMLGYILPNKFFNTDYGKGLREFITQTSYLSRIVDFRSLQIFKNATTYTCLLFLKKIKNKIFEYAKVDDLGMLNTATFALLNAKDFNDETWAFSNNQEATIIKKLKTDSVSLINVPCDISRGSSTGNDKIFVLELKKGSYYNGYGELVEIENEILKKPIYATDFNRYYFNNKSPYYLIFPYLIEETKSSLLSEKLLQEKFPKTYAYLISKKVALLERRGAKNWYGYSAARSLNLHYKADIIIPLLANHGMFALLPPEKKNYTLMAGGGFSITIKNAEVDADFLLGLLNSKLLFWHLQHLSNLFRGGWITCTKQYFSQLRIKTINDTNKHIKDKISNAVKQLINSNQNLSIAQTENESNFLKNKIDSLERQIDRLVFELYNLSAEEIRIITN